MPRACPCIPFLLALVPLCVLAGSADAKPREVRVKDRPGLERALRSARPGTRILLAPGTYAGGLQIAGLHGKDPQLKDPAKGNFTFARKGSLKRVGPRTQ